MDEGIGGLGMHVRLRHLLAGMALLVGLLVTPVAHTLPVAAQDNTARTIALDVFRCPPGVTVQQMSATDCIPISSDFDVTITSINGNIAPLTIADATLEGNTFRWSTVASGSTTDEWGFKHGALPEGTSAFLVQGDGVSAGQSGAFDYRFTTSANSPAASLDMYLLMSANAPVIEPPAEPTAATQPGNVTPQPTAGLRPSPPATSTPEPTQAPAAADDSTGNGSSDQVDAASTGDSASVAPAGTANSFVAGDQVVVSDGPVNLRSTAGVDGALVTQLPQGTALTVQAGPTNAGGFAWYQVQTASNQTGWVAGSYLQLAPGPNGTFSAGDQVVVFDGPVNLRSSAGTSAPIVQSLPQESVLTVVAGPTAANGYAWYQVQTVDGASGWVAADFIEKIDTPNPPAGGDLTVGNRAVVTDGPVNLRSAAGIGNSMVAVLQTGDTMTVTGGPAAADGYTWYQVNTDTGSTGWVASAFIQKRGYANGDVVIVNTDSLNVRSAPGLNSTVLDTVYQGTTAVITGGPTTADGRDWYKIDVSGVVSGWVAGDYLAGSDAPPVNPPTGVYGPGDWIFVSDPPLNLRATPSTSGELLASLSDGDGMLVLSEATIAEGYSWNQVENDGVTGYVATEYVTGGFALGEVAVVADGPVNLRAAAGNGSAILQGLAQGAQVSVLNVNPQVVDGVYWFQVTTTDAVTGWVAGRYLGPVSA